MLQSLVDTSCELSVVKTPRFAVGIVVMSVTLSEIISTSGWDCYIAISGCPSMSHLLMDTFFNFGVVENFV